mgnify:CR=1 FL=1
MKLNEFYVAVDGNYEDAMERLQNEMFVGKFLRMLPRDGSMMLLEKAMADGRANDAFRAVLCHGAGRYPEGHCPESESDQIGCCLFPADGGAAGRRHHPPAGP